MPWNLLENRQKDLILIHWQHSLSHSLLSIPCSHHLSQSIVFMLSAFLLSQFWSNTNFFETQAHVVLDFLDPHFCFTQFPIRRYPPRPLSVPRTAVLICRDKKALLVPSCVCDREQAGTGRPVLLTVGRAEVCEGGYSKFSIWKQCLWNYKRLR